MDLEKFITENIFLCTIYAVLLLTWAAEMYHYLKYYTVIARRNRRERKGKLEFSEERPPVSVIVCARDERYNLERFLPLLLEQNYEEFEVIVVDDGSWDNSEEVLADLKRKYKNLYYTTIPSAARVVSRKKLAITVGVKAAKYEHLLLTEADCRPVSSEWISGMMRNFTEEKDFVLGYGGYYRKSTLLGSLSAYDTLFTAMRYMGYAYYGKPYMAVGRNLAYRKSMFMEHKGFAGSLHIASGDDDLLVNALGNKRNTAIETAASSKTLSQPRESWADWFREKREMLSTVPAYTSRSRRMIVAEPAIREIYYAAFVLALVFTEINAVTWGVICGIFAVRYVTQLIVINRAAHTMKESGFGVSVMIWDILLPIITLIITILDKAAPRKHKISR